MLTKQIYALTAEGVTPTNPINTYTYGYGAYNWGDLLLSYRGVSFQCDRIGNPLSYYNGSEYTFTWEQGRRLATATVGGNELQFTYNDEGIRTSKTVNGVTHTYSLNGSQIITEEWDGKLLVYLYDAEGSPIGMQYRSSSLAQGFFYTYWFEKNLQGDIVAVYNSSGVKMISYVYDAWGNFTTTYYNGCTASSFASLNPFRYRGYYYDTELGMYYLQSRYYDPVIGRFINADSQFDSAAGFVGYNLFAYCANSPVSFKDTSGKAIETAVDIISAAISLIELIGSPSWVNAGYLVWDVVSAVIPVLPGSYVVKGGKIILKIGSKIDDFADGSKLLTGTYKGLKKIFKGIGDIEIHHLVEKRFKGLFSSMPNDFLSIPLPKELHKEITKKWRNLHKIDDAFDLFKYGSDYSKISIDAMEKAIEEVYKDMPGLIDEVLEWVRKNWRQ